MIQAVHSGKMSINRCLDAGNNKNKAQSFGHDTGYSKKPESLPWWGARMFVTGAAFSLAWDGMCNAVRTASKQPTIKLLDMTKNAGYLGAAFVVLNLVWNAVNNVLRPR